MISCIYPPGKNNALTSEAEYQIPGQTRMTLAAFATREVVGSYIDQKAKIQITTGNLIQGGKYFCKYVNCCLFFRTRVPTYLLPLAHSCTHIFPLFQSPGTCFGREEWVMQSSVCLLCVWSHSLSNCSLFAGLIDKFG